MLDALGRLFGRRPPSARRLDDEWQRSLARNFRYWEFLDSTIVLVDGRPVVGLELAPVAADALTTGQKNDAYRAMNAALDAFPENCHYQFFAPRYLATPDQIRAQLPSLRSSDSSHVDRLVAHRDQYLVDLAALGYLYEPRWYLFVTFSPSAQWDLDSAEARELGPRPRVESALPGSRKLRQRFRREHERMLEDLEPEIEKITSALRNAGVRARRMTDEENFELVAREVNPGWTDAGGAALDRRHLYAGSKPARFVADSAAWPPSAREQLVYSDVVRRSDHMEANGQLFRSLYLKKLPKRAVPGLVERITAGLFFPYSLSVNIEIRPKAEHLKELRSREATHSSVGSGTFNNAIPLDTRESRHAAGELDRLIDDAIDGFDRPVNVGLILTFAAPDARTLKRRTAEAVAVFRDMRAVEYHNRNRAFEVWRAGLPAHGQSDEWTIENRRTCAASLVPVWGRYRGTTGWPAKAPTGYPLILAPNDQGELVAIDPYQTRGRHMAIFGGTGSGKTNFATSILLRHRRHPESLAICYDATRAADGQAGDAGGSYERFARLCGGEYVPVGLDMPNFNPFALRLADEEQEGMKCDDEGVPFFAYVQCLSFLETLLIEDSRPTVDKATLSLLYKVLQSLMRRWPHHDDPPRMDQFLKELEGFAHGDERARGVYDTLSLYGPDTPFGFYLSRTDHVFDTKNALVCFDLENIKDFGRDARAVVLMITNWGARHMAKASNRPKRKLIVGDELGDWIDGPLGPAFERYAAKLRKENGCVMYITQDVADVNTRSAGRRMIANTPIKILFELNDRIDEYRKQYGLTSADCQIIASLGGGGGAGDNTATRSCFIKLGSRRTRLSLPEDPVNYWVKTTHPPDTRLLGALHHVWGMPGRDIDELAFYERVAARYPPGWTEFHDVDEEVRLILAESAKSRRPKP